MRIPGDGLGHQAALIKADIARGCANQPRHGVGFHILGHVEADQFDSHGHCQLPRHFCFAHAGRAGEQEASYRLVFFTQPCPRHLDGR